MPSIFFVNATMCHHFSFIDKNGQGKRKRPHNSPDGVLLDDFLKSWLPHPQDKQHPPTFSTINMSLQRRAAISWALLFRVTDDLHVHSGQRNDSSLRNHRHQPRPLDNWNTLAVRHHCNHVTE
ncbi:hypothetical protein, unlikely [Trypanosoma congolense IL3000]|uniref:Uncharacterized protein n=1 Tax=Trypanosoma congolense (strain IL3000) TaxID=1068625 RepID=F9WAR5_TRYCI|nr:hypothetical protein, unlikely [Trypanosoma congolense IL3000]